MHFLKHFIIGTLLTLTLFLVNSSVYAQQTTILPGVNETTSTGKQCTDYYCIDLQHRETDPPVKSGECLGRKIQCGSIYLEDIPYFIRNLIEFLIYVAGILAVLIFIYGGYLYIVGDISSQKAKGKDVIQKALTGFVIVLLAWVIVRVLITLFANVLG